MSLGHFVERGIIECGLENVDWIGLEAVETPYSGYTPCPTQVIHTAFETLQIRKMGSQLVGYIYNPDSVKDTILCFLKLGEDNPLLVVHLAFAGSPLGVVYENSLTTGFASLCRFTYLDENKTLILAILDNQNLGKLAECAQYQAQLQKNLMYLAAIADAQPQAPAVPSQMPPHPAMQQGGHYMQHPQAALQQPSGYQPKTPMQFNPQQLQEHQRQQLHQHQQALQGHMGIRPGVNNGGVGPASAISPSGGGGASSSPVDVREGKQDGVEAGSGNVQGSAATGHNSANGELPYTKGSENAK
ncbi:hypothetical protein IFM89_012547 [Coptis chinensis]|uniref:SS18 N-terminal domain-containing protein n=1 Tax=Coptis chinensis TaxID=261450 RepID=A0A835HPN6_9MAGN|nr:hypothetical protein IFM89_012547 [Coptis chinensis]